LGSNADAVVLRELSGLEGEQLQSVDVGVTRENRATTPGEFSGGGSDTIEGKSVTRPAAVHRELPASRRVPYAAHVAPEVIVTTAGDYVQTFRLTGASFESADDERLNNWHERLNVTWRNIATPNVSLWTHLVRRRDVSQLTTVAGGGFADRLARHYQARLATETLMVNEIYLTVLFRPITGAAPTLVSRFLSKQEAPSARAERVNALEACAKLRQTVAASLVRYEPETLGVYMQGDRRYSSLLEFLGFLLNGDWQRVALPRAAIAEVLATSRGCSAARRLSTGHPRGHDLQRCSGSRNIRRRQL
jgi:type IV secretion system protein VirB4